MRTTDARVTSRSASADEASPSSARCDHETGRLRPLERTRRASPVLLLRASSRDPRRTALVSARVLCGGRECAVEAPSRGFCGASAAKTPEIIAPKSAALGTTYRGIDWRIRGSIDQERSGRSKRPLQRYCTRLAGHPRGRGDRPARGCVSAGRRPRRRPSRPRRARETPGRATQTRSRFGTGMSRPWIHASRPTRVGARRRAWGPRGEMDWPPSADGRTCSSPPWRRLRP